MMVNSSGSNNPDAISADRRPAASLDEYISKHFEPIIRDEVNAFLQAVDQYVVRVTDVDRAGKDLPRAIAEIYENADLMAAWAMETVGKGDQDRHRFLVVRVLGEPQRTHLLVESLGGIELVADLSINAVRRLSLAEGGPMTIELPAGRLMAFERGGGDERDG